MAELRPDEASRKILEERLRSQEGQEILNRLARLIAQSAAKHMPADLLRSLDTQEGQAAFREAWPEIVDAFLFRRAPPRKASKPRKEVEESRQASRQRRVAKQERKARVRFRRNFERNVGMGLLQVKASGWW